MLSTQKKCPMCAEEIPLTSEACDYCGAKFEVTSTGYCENCHQVREADKNGQCKVCGKAVLDLRMESRFVKEPAQAPLSVSQPTAQTERTRTGKNRLPISILAAVLVFAVIGAVVWFGQNGLPAVSSLFATITPTATTTFFPTITAITTLTPTRTPHPTPIITPDLRVLNPANQHRYLYVKERKSWHQARDYCALQGGHLVTIQDAAENTFIYKMASGFTWLGATDEVKERVWIWVSREPWTFVNWDQGEPNNCCPGEYCASATCSPEHYLEFSPDSAAWNDVPQDNKFLVCEWESGSP